MERKWLCKPHFIVFLSEMRMSIDSVSRKNNPHNEARTKATTTRSISYTGEPYHEHLALCPKSLQC